jgi:hypothetical protein
MENVFEHEQIYRGWTDYKMGNQVDWAADQSNWAIQSVSLVRLEFGLLDP